jgi:hypothetical protein
MSKPANQNSRFCSTSNSKEKQTLEQTKQELKTRFPDYESAISFLAKITMAAEQGKSGERGTIDIEAQFFEMLFSDNNLTTGTRLALARFIAPNSKVGQIAFKAIQTNNRAAGSKGPQKKMESTAKKYEKAKQLYLSELEKYRRLSAYDAASQLIEDYANLKLSRRKLQTLIPMWNLVDKPT